MCLRNYISLSLFLLGFWCLLQYSITRYIIKEIVFFIKLYFQISLFFLVFQYSLYQNYVTRYIIKKIVLCFLLFQKKKESLVLLYVVFRFKKKFS